MPEWRGSMPFCQVRRHAVELQRFPGGIPESEDHVNSFFKTLEGPGLELFAFRYVVNAYPFVVTARIFHAFTAQPRQGLVTKPLSRAFVHLVHFMIVFLTDISVWVYMDWLHMHVPLRNRGQGDCEPHLRRKHLLPRAAG